MSPNVPTSAGPRHVTSREPMESAFAGGGEMGAQMRSFDWSRTVLGPVEDWPQSLRIAVRILLGSGYLMLICWGPECTMLYNDAYRPILGRTKHPGALGRSCREVFSEAWDFIGALFAKVMSEGQDASTLADQLFLLDRNGYLEECRKVHRLIGSLHPAGLGEPVYVDTEMWEKIVLNLLSNAFKFTFEGTAEASPSEALSSQAKAGPCSPCFCLLKQRFRHRS